MFIFMSMIVQFIILQLEVTSLEMDVTIRSYKLQIKFYKLQDYDMFMFNVYVIYLMLICHLQFRMLDTLYKSQLGLHVTL